MPIKIAYTPDITKVLFSTGKTKFPGFVSGRRTCLLDAILAILPNIIKSIPQRINIQLPTILIFLNINLLLFLYLSFNSNALFRINCRSR